MKVLWIVNILFPAARDFLGLAHNGIGGGWLLAGANALHMRAPELHLAIATVYPGSELLHFDKNGLSYFLLPRQNTDRFFAQIHKNFSPDIVHIHGTEYYYGKSYLKACGAKNTVVSIQGLTSIYSRYFYGGMSIRELLYSTTLRDLLRFDTLWHERRDMVKRGLDEQWVLRNVNHIIGRTDWDRAHSWALNPRANYYECNETLRETFYQHRWLLDRADTHSIFLSQLHYPIKGGHQLLKAFPLVLREFPDAHIVVAGHDFCHARFGRMRSYGKFLNTLIRRNRLDGKIRFTGALDEEAMCQCFLQSHIFVCPSCIENSPNSLGEAQLLGVPSVCAVSGGTPNMVTDGKDGLLYRFEETEMLAEKICTIFRNDALARQISMAAQVSARERHNAILNAERLLDIYRKILATPY